MFFILPSPVFFLFYFAVKQKENLAEQTNRQLAWRTPVFWLSLFLKPFITWLVLEQFDGLKHRSDGANRNSADICKKQKDQVIKMALTKNIDVHQLSQSTSSIKLRWTYLQNFAEARIKLFLQVFTLTGLQLTRAGPKPSENHPKFSKKGKLLL